MIWAIAMTAILLAGFSVIIGVMLSLAAHFQTWFFVGIACMEVVACGCFLMAIWPSVIRERREARRLKPDTPTLLEQWDAFWLKAERIAREI